MPDIRKLFSIIIPCHNSIEWVVRCYQSIVKQTFGMDQLEVIFVDDASTDDTFALLCEMEKQYTDSIAVIHLEENIRQGGARNVALQYATGDYIVFVDSDDWIDLEMCSKLADIIEKWHPDIIKFSHDIVSENNIRLKEVKQDMNGFFQINSEEERRNLLMTEVLDYGCWNKVYKRSLIEQVGVGFAEKVVYEEPKFTYPLYFYVNSFYLLDEMLYHYTFNTKGTMQKEMRVDRKLYDHLIVQAQTYEFVKGRLEEELWTCFQNEIEAYLVKSFFCETILFAGWGRVLLELSVLDKMKEWVRQNFPNYEKNIYVQEYFSEEHKAVLETIKTEFTQEQLNRFCEELGNRKK